MKIIISHDVDHLFWNEHIHDLTYPKLWVRQTAFLLKREVSLKEWLLRVGSTFSPVRNCIAEVMQFDTIHRVPSTFFFGMSNGLGLSYNKIQALPVIKFVQKSSFAVGVHGIEFSDINIMKKEYDDFFSLIGEQPDGIRIHYVRYDQYTLEKLAGIGYKYDSTEFDKRKGFCLREPYKVKEMWEFPICIMDSYLPPSFDRAKYQTLSLLNIAESIGLSYFTVLFHDTYYNKAYLQKKIWYDWFIQYIEKSEKYQFISFGDAVNELGKI